jgi:hypothetical protein
MGEKLRKSRHANSIGVAARHREDAENPLGGMRRAIPTKQHQKLRTHESKGMARL